MSARAGEGEAHLPRCGARGLQGAVQACRAAPLHEEHRAASGRQQRPHRANSQRQPRRCSRSSGGARKLLEAAPTHAIAICAGAHSTSERVQGCRGCSACTRACPRFPAVRDSGAGARGRRRRGVVPRAAQQRPRCARWAPRARRGSERRTLLAGSLSRRVCWRWGQPGRWRSSSERRQSRRERARATGSQAAENRQVVTAGLAHTASSSTARSACCAHARVALTAAWQRPRAAAA